MSDSKMTPGDYAKHMDEIGQALRPAADLLDFVKRNHPKGPLRSRLPFALRTPEPVAPDGIGLVQVMPSFPMQPLHMVLSDDTAESFDLCGWYSGMQIEQGSMAALPLESFAVRYYARQEDPRVLLAVQDWSHRVLEAGTTLFMNVRNISKAARHFRGILWTACELPSFP